MKNGIIERRKRQAKTFIDANVNDGEDRSGSKDCLFFTPDELQELVDDLIEHLHHIKPQ